MSVGNYQARHLRFIEFGSGTRLRVEAASLVLGRLPEFLIVPYRCRDSYTRTVFSEQSPVDPFLAFGGQCAVKRRASEDCDVFGVTTEIKQSVVCW